MKRLTVWGESGYADIAALLDSNSDLWGNFAYEDLVALSEALNKLAAYEDAEEQGLLVRLPVAVGTKVYTVDKGTFDCDQCHNKYFQDDFCCTRRAGCVCDNNFDVQCHAVEGYVVDGAPQPPYVRVSDPGSWWPNERFSPLGGCDGEYYLTREAAEAALKELRPEEQEGGH